MAKFTQYLYMLNITQLKINAYFITEKIAIAQEGTFRGCLHLKEPGNPPKMCTVNPRVRINNLPLLSAAII